MSTRKNANPKESSTSIPNSLKDRKKRSDHERLEALSRHYYTKNKFTSPLEALAIAVMDTEKVKSEWVQSMQYSKQDATLSEKGTELTQELIEYEVVAEWERFEWMPQSDMLRHVASLVAKGDTKGLQEFASAQANYEEGLANVTYKDARDCF